VGISTCLMYKAEDGTDDSEPLLWVLYAVLIINSLIPLPEHHREDKGHRIAEESRWVQGTKGETSTTASGGLQGTEY
jgi:hypothetical protein